MGRGCTTPQKYMEIPIQLPSHQEKKAKLRLLVFLIALSMIKFNADFINNMPIMAEGTTPQNYMEIQIHLVGHQARETDLLHDNEFAGVLDRISNE